MPTGRERRTRGEHFSCTRDYNSPTVGVLCYLLEAFHQLPAEEQEGKGCVWRGEPLALPTPASSPRQASADLQKAWFMAFLFSGRLSWTWRTCFWADVT